MTVSSCLLVLIAYSMVCWMHDFFNIVHVHAMVLLKMSVSFLLAIHVVCDVEKNT